MLCRLLPCRGYLCFELNPMTSRTEKNARRSMFNVHPPPSIPVQRRGGRNSRERPGDRYNGADRSPKSNHASYRVAGCLVASGQSTTTQPLRVRVEPHQSLQPTRDKEAHQLGQQTRFQPGINHSGGRVGRRFSRKELAPPNRAPTNRAQIPSQPEPVRRASQSSEGVQETLTWASPNPA